MNNGARHHLPCSRGSSRGRSNGCSALPWHTFDYDIGGIHRRARRFFCGMLSGQSCGLGALPRLGSYNIWRLGLLRMLYSCGASRGRSNGRPTQADALRLHTYVVHRHFGYGTASYMRPAQTDYPPLCVKADVASHVGRLHREILQQVCEAGDFSFSGLIAVGPRFATRSTLATTHAGVGQRRSSRSALTDQHAGHFKTDLVEALAARPMLRATRWRTTTTSARRSRCPLRVSTARARGAPSWTSAARARGSTRAWATTFVCGDINRTGGIKHPRPTGARLSQGGRRFPQGRRRYRSARHCHG